MTDTKAAPDEPRVAPNGEQKKTCFVVIGFGKKTDYATGRTLDLDLTYTKLIKPAFEAAGVECFRAIDVNVSGSIDILMYRWIFQADFVIADLSTMNANVFYELGVRYAQRPNTTLIMAENRIFEKLPFDLSHTIIYGYEHLGEEIAQAEVDRFVPLLTEQVRKLVAEPPDFDSPVYTYLQGMKEPQWKDATQLIKELEAQLAAKQAFEQATQSDELLDPALVEQQALSGLIDAAEAAKNRKDYASAVRRYKTVIERAEQAATAARPAAAGEGVPLQKVKIDESLWQRLALVTYKQVEKHDRGDPEANQEAIATLEEAMDILYRECDAKVSTDPETLGLSGAINKRLYERTDDRKFFKRSVGFYERGFYIKQDYYNGINVAFMYTMDAADLAEQGETFEAIVNYGHANIIRRKVADICTELIADKSTFEKRSDQEWVYLSLWEAYFGLGEELEAEELEPDIEQVITDFGRDTWTSQREKLSEAITRFRSFVDVAGVGDRGGQAPAASEPVAEAAPVLAAAPPATATRTFGPGEPITVDFGSRPVKSVEVRVEFA